jgi:hypothetical protein
MRTTLDIDDDVLEAVKELARREKKTAGAKLSELARLAILGPEPAVDPSGGFGEEAQKPLAPGDWPTFPRRPGPRRIITNAHVQRVQDEIDREEVEHYNQLHRGERD